MAAAGPAAAYRLRMLLPKMKDSASTVAEKAEKPARMSMFLREAQRGGSKTRTAKGEVEPALLKSFAMVIP